MRFHHGRDYGRVMHRQQKAAGKYAVVLVAPRRASQPTPRIGIMVSTKTADSAVRRHQLKRWIRECFRTRLRERAAGFDVVVLMRRDPPAKAHAELDAEVTKLLDQALTAASAPRSRSGGRRK
jgi:ribonuclease P protein component